MKVEELSIETLVDLPAEPTLELVPHLAVMRVSFFLRSPDVYNPLQMSTGARLTSDQGTYGAKCNLFNFHHG